MSKKILFVLLFLPILVNGQIRFNQSEVDSILGKSFSKKFNGNIILQFDDELFYYEKGLQDMERLLPIKRNTPFVIGSISKQFTAVLLLQLYDKGLVKLDLPIGNYLKDLTQPWKDVVTLHQLLTHTHGIQSKDLPTSFEPGSSYEYSQIGFQLIAEIIEEVGGIPFSKSAQLLFENCKMQISFHPDLLPKGTKLLGYTRKEDGNFIIENDALQNYPAAGSFISTVDDLIQWNRHLHQGKLLSSESYQLMHTAYPVALRNHPVFGKTLYGYGTTVESTKKPVQLGQTGFAPGYACMNFYFPDRKASIIILSNVVEESEDFANVFSFHNEMLQYFKKKIEAK